MSFAHIVHAGLAVEKLEWGNSDQINKIIQKYPGGFDLILGADIYILYNRSLLMTSFFQAIWTNKRKLN